VAVDAATTDQLADLRGDLADTAATPAFSDAELQRLWQRANGRHERTLYLAVRQLLMQANRFHDYMYGQGASDQKKIAGARQPQGHADRAGGVRRGERGGRERAGLAPVRHGEHDDRPGRSGG
jgi:hypothetical protein